MYTRTIVQLVESPLHRGFLGEGHMAAAVINATDFFQTDPFILLMDDRLDLAGGPPVGGPHPHAGFETVTLVLKGDERDWITGSLELMTAGKGIIHSEVITAKSSLRILQMWLVLAPEKRWIAPAWQQLLPSMVPAIKTTQLNIRVYSGNSNGVSSPLRNNTPLILVDVVMEKIASFTQVLPAAYNALVYVIEGHISVGETSIGAGQAGWLNIPAGSGDSEIIITTTGQEARIVLYAAEPHHAPVVNHGPFIGDSRDDIARLYQEYKEGRLPHLNELPESSKIVYG